MAQRNIEGAVENVHTYSPRRYELLRSYLEALTKRALQLATEYGVRTTGEKKERPGHNILRGMVEFAEFLTDLN